MSNFSFIELEQFYNEATLLFGELRDKKLLKKLPDDISSRIVGLLDQYVIAEKEASSPEGCLEFDSRRDGEVVPANCYSSNDITDFIWRGNVEVKGLIKGQKLLKNFCIAHGNRLSLFAGSKKKPLKAQMVLTNAAHVEMIPDGKKHGNLYSITELAYPVVTVKFPSVDEGQQWLEAYKASQLSTVSKDNELVLSYAEEEEDDEMLYEALEDIDDSTQSAGSFATSHSTGELSKSVSFASQDLLQSEGGSMTHSDSRQSQLSLNRTDSQLSHVSEKRNEAPSPEFSEIIKEEDMMKVLEEDVPSCWGEFSYQQVYQTEWSFNLSQTVLPGKNLLSLKRGQMVLIKEQVNSDWWEAVDCRGKEGFVASCFLSLAFE